MGGISGQVTVSPSASDYLDAHLNVYWLRPESALWDAIASAVIARHPFESPSVDLGSGNGIFSFITAGGMFAPRYDWYRNVDPSGFWENRDIYDVVESPPDASSIARAPRFRIDYAIDAKQSLLDQAIPLGLYGEARLGDANGEWPLQAASVQTLFSNILYWLRSPEHALGEIRRVLRHGGRAILCLQDHRFKELCFTYSWREKNSELLRLLNRGRADSHYWTTSYDEFAHLAESQGLRVADHATYLSPLTLQAWDIGLRPLSPALIRMTKMLNEDQRASIKAEWMEICRPLLRELLDRDAQSDVPGGFHLFSLEKP